MSYFFPKRVDDFLNSFFLSRFCWISIDADATNFCRL